MMQMVKTRIDCLSMGYPLTLFEPFLWKYFLIRRESRKGTCRFGNWHGSNRWTRENDMAWWVNDHGALRHRLDGAVLRQPRALGPTMEMAIVFPIFPYEKM